MTPSPKIAVAEPHHSEDSICSVLGHRLVLDGGVAAVGSSVSKPGAVRHMQRPYPQGAGVERIIRRANEYREEAGNRNTMD